MSEVLTGQTYDVRFAVPNGLSTATFTVLKNETQIVPSGNAAIDGDVATVPLPYSAVDTEGELTVTLTFTWESVTYNKSRYVSVVTPYLDLFEVKEVLETTSDKEAAVAESAARHIVNAHTGQTFGLTTKTLTVEGHGEDALRLPERLVELTGLYTLTAELDINSAIVVSDGWYLKKRWHDSVSELETDDEYFAEGYRPGGIIYAPSLGGRGTEWRDDYPFKVEGDWGYRSVPEPVREAMKLLVNDYACMESTYRDKYLESIRAADWRLQYNSRAWQHTGNARADQLLSDYVLLNWAVV